MTKKLSAGREVTVFGCTSTYVPKHYSRYAWHAEETKLKEMESASEKSREVGDEKDEKVISETTKKSEI